MQSRLRQARSSGQSGSVRQPMAIQPVKGSPSNPSAHRQLEMWFWGKQMALEPQGSLIKHGLMQLPSTQVSGSLQSSSDWHPGSKHAIRGLPIFPGGHLHTGLWFSMKHSAPLPQLQGSIQIRLTQASLRLHSSSRTQPGGFSMGIGTQLRSVSGTQPVRHEQIMVRKGTVSTTEQTAVASHGFSSKQGFRHRLSRQARPDGQSASVTHSGSSIGMGSCLGVHKTKGSPTYPGGQAHEASWLIVL